MYNFRGTNVSGLDINSHTICTEMVKYLIFVERAPTKSTKICIPQIFLALWYLIASKSASAILCMSGTVTIASKVCNICLISSFVTNREVAYKACA